MKVLGRADRGEISLGDIAVAIQRFSFAQPVSAKSALQPPSEFLLLNSLQMQQTLHRWPNLSLRRASSAPVRAAPALTGRRAISTSPASLPALFESPLEWPPTNTSMS